jgi:addiction module HigA family antidote
MTQDARQPRRPTAPGDVLREEILKEYGITQEELASAMRVSRYTVNQIINDRRTVTAEMALRLGKATSTSPDFWLNLQRTVDLYDAQQRLRDSIGEVRVIVRSKRGAELFNEVPD